MLSEEHRRRLARLERQLRRDDPDFCARMNELAAGRVPRRVPVKAAAAIAIWLVALVFAVLGWWIPAVIAAVWAAGVIGIMISRR